MRSINIFILISILAVSSCVDPFIPEIASYDDVLYIECLLNNDTVQPQTVKISHSTPIISETESQGIIRPAYVSGAIVVVHGPENEIHEFTETDPGRYIADPEFIPSPGNAYSLSVILGENIYESDLEVMKECPQIDSISHKHTVERLSESSPIYDGYSFYVSTHEEDEGPSYYRWQSDATYFFRSFYDASHIWDGRNQIPANNNDVKYCWITNKMKGIYSSNTEGLSVNSIIETPLHFQSQFGDALSIRYSLNVKQYSISETAWQFWDDMARQVNDNGGMYDTQPFRIQGNIRCTSDPSVLVTGIFEVAGYSEKRIYVDRPMEFDIIPVFCQWEEIGTRDLPWYQIPRGSYIVYDYNAGAYFYSSPQCFDCTLKGGSLEKPAFWEDGN